ncbi:MAG: GyrI-like domain-containing protein [Candidatus Bipolaricaulota bacterium]
MPLTEVRIVDLPPMRVASALGFGRHPEDQASTAITRFARAKGWVPGSPGVRLFGFSNPNPTPGSPNYGYEGWLVVGPEVDAEPPIEIERVPAGKYAVTHCVGLEHLGERWRALSVWVEGSPDRFPACGDRCLEEFLNLMERDRSQWAIDLHIVIGC